MYDLVELEDSYTDWQDYVLYFYECESCNKITCIKIGSGAGFSGWNCPHCKQQYKMWSEVDIYFNKLDEKK